MPIPDPRPHSAPIRTAARMGLMPVTEQDRPRAVPLAVIHRAFTTDTDTGENSVEALTATIGAFAHTRGLWWPSGGVEPAKADIMFLTLDQPDPLKDMLIAVSRYLEPVLLIAPTVDHLMGLENLLRPVASIATVDGSLMPQFAGWHDALSAPAGAPLAGGPTLRMV